VPEIKSIPQNFDYGAFAVWRRDNYFDWRESNGNPDEMDDLDYSMTVSLEVQNHFYQWTFVQYPDNLRDNQYFPDERESLFDTMKRGEKPLDFLLDVAINFREILDLEESITSPSIIVEAKWPNAIGWAAEMSVREYLALNGQHKFRLQISKNLASDDYVSAVQNLRPDLELFLKQAEEFSSKAICLSPESDIEMRLKP
jgi:hypothetical protein